MKNKTSSIFKSFLVLLAFLFISSSDGFSKGNKIAKDFKKVGKTMKKGFGKLGKSGAVDFLKEIKNVIKCIPKFTKTIPHLMQHPNDKQAFNSIEKCMNDVKKMSSDCDKPDMLALGAVPDIGGEICMGCNQVNKYNMELKFLESEMQKAQNLAGNPEGAAKDMAMNQVQNAEGMAVNSAQRRVNKRTRYKQY